VNAKEFSKIMAFISAAINREIPVETYEVYYEMLRDMDYELAFAAAKKAIGEDEYPTLPTIGKLRKAAQSLCTMDRLSAPEAWGLVQKAIRRHGYYGEAEAMALLPPEVAETAKQMGWAEICHSEKPDVIRAQFMRMYETTEARKKEVDMLPDDVRRMVQGVGDKLKLPGVSE